MFGTLARLKSFERSQGLQLNKRTCSIGFNIAPKVGIASPIDITDAFQKQCLASPVAGPTLLVGDADLLWRLPRIISLQANKLLSENPTRIRKISVVPQRQGAGREQVFVMRPVRFLWKNRHPTISHDRDGPRCQFDLP